MIDRREAAEAHGEIARLDGYLRLLTCLQGEDCHVLVAFALHLRQQRDEGLFERTGFGARQQVLRRAGGEHPPVVHGDQPVEARGLFHVGGGDQHTHAGPVGTDALDEFPELPSRQRVDAGGGLVEDQQVGIVDQRATEAELLLHAAGQLAGEALGER